MYQYPNSYIIQSSESSAYTRGDYRPPYINAPRPPPPGPRHR